MVIGPETRGSTPTASRVEVSWGDRSLRLRDLEIFSTSGTELLACFLRRVFSVDEVRSVRIDRPRGTAAISYKPGESTSPKLLQRIAEAIRGRETEEPDSGLRLDACLPADLSEERLTIHRHRTILSTWEVVHDEPGLIRVRREGLTRESSETARRLNRIEAIHGVQGCRFRPLSGTFAIRFDADKIRWDRLLRALDSVPDPFPARLVEGTDPPLVKFGLANTAVALSLVSERLGPALSPFAAGLLLGTNLATLRDAGIQVGSGQVGLPVLYTGIAAATLATAQFVTWAAMTWMLTYWNLSYQRQFAE